MIEGFVSTVWWVPLYALAGMILALPWSVLRRTGPRPAGYINLLMTFTAFVHSLIALIGIWGQPARELNFTWLQIDRLALMIPIEISALTVGALLLITGMNLLAQLYAVAYLEMDWGWARFFGLLGFFEAGMAALVLCNSLFFSYFILELLTLGTYLLVGFWFNQPLVVTGARDAFLTKRVGDLFLMMGVIALWPLAGTFHYGELAQWASTAQLDPTLATLIGLGLIAGPLGKCAQFPLHLWLDEAMEGPLPSTILRNSVVVATGAWVLIKLYPVLALSPLVLTVLMIIGGITALGGSLVALAQVDIKRALSYLTSVYLGIVFIAVGSAQLEAALLFLLAHAVAMGLLVMAVGSVILNSITQDLGQMGGLWAKRPATGISFLVGMAGLVALPPLGGFWALYTLVVPLAQTQPLLVALLLVINTLTTFSLARVFGLVFLGSATPMTQRSPEAAWQMILPMTGLMGFVLHLPLVLNFLGLLPTVTWAQVPILALILLSSALGGTGFWLRPLTLPWPQVHELLAQDFYTAQVYRLTITWFVGWVAKITDLFDRYIIDGAVNLATQVSLASGEALKYSTNGQTQFYVLTVVVGTMLISLFMMF